MMKYVIAVILSAFLFQSFAQKPTLREKINFDDNWYFTFGHPFDKTKDFYTGTSYFTYLAKARYGADGAAAIGFDHRAWRKLNLPHDWAVEMPFDAKGSHSHGYKAVGPGFPDVSVGWYRKSFRIEKGDLGKQIFLDFDGVSRDSKVWVNGHYLGNEPSGYQSFSYNITDILNYDSENVVAVRTDVSMEEGWYYEGAGIYRHVWLRKTPALHVPKNGTFISTEIKEGEAIVKIATEIENRGNANSQYYLRQQILNADSKVVAECSGELMELDPLEKGLYEQILKLKDPHLWSLEDPYQHTMITEVVVNDEVLDSYATKFGIRSIRFDANKGFFLNGKHVKLKGTNNHQDHAGVGCAMPDELIRWRLQQLKNFGSNAIRSSHNPPTPELLSLCDEMGILVINENRLMGTTEKALHELERLIKRDRNHPSVIVWSIGNEEWDIEGSIIGIRMTQTMQNFAKTIDSTRPVNVAISGGWGYGSSHSVEIMGFNYLIHGDTDEHHIKFPNQPSIGTEEGSTFATRGIYFEDDARHYKPAYDLKPREGWYTIQEGWKHYAERDYLSGMFIWTGFDYRGEPTPYNWPSVTSYFGMMDLCGFPKDNVFYLKSWWQNDPVLHILPHWDWQGKEGDTIDVWVYSNCEEVELSLNGKALGRKKMMKNGHLTWQVPYVKGTLKANGYNKGKLILQSERKTAQKASQIQISSNKISLNSKIKDVAMLTVEVLDKKGNHVPTANQLIEFEIKGPGKIIGVGNGDPTSLEKEVFVDEYEQIVLDEVEIGDFSDEDIQSYLNEIDRSILDELSNDSIKVLTTSFSLNSISNAEQLFTWYYNHLGEHQLVFLNGIQLNESFDSNVKDVAFNLKKEFLKPGLNKIVVLSVPFKPKHQWDNPNKKPGVIQIISKAQNSKRKLFNGLAQVIVQTTGESGEIVLKATSDGLKTKEIQIRVK